MILVNTVVRLVRPLGGLPTRDDFSISQEPLPDIQDQEVLFRAIYMSVDAGMRAKLPDLEKVPDPLMDKLAIGEVMHCGAVPPMNGYTGGLIGQVIASRHAGFSAGNFVHGGRFCQEY